MSGIWYVKQYNISLYFDILGELEVNEDEARNN
jgi:hypothetical protein